MSLPRFSVTKPVPVNLLMMATIIAGVFALFIIRREFFPETTPDQAMVSLPYPGATPQEIEESMARKVEDALADLDEVERLTTTLSEGGGGILVEFRQGEDIFRAIREVENAVDALADLPDEAEEIRVTEFEPNLPAIMVTIYGDADEEVLKRAIRRVRDDLKKLPGMGDITISGVRDYEVRVDVDEAALLEYRISLPQVSDAIRSWMADVPGGTVRTNVGNINVRTLGVAERAEAIRQIVVRATPDGQVLRVGDIATVHEDFVDDQIERRFNGLPSVSLVVYKTGDQDAVEIAKMTRAYVAGRRGEPFDGSVLEDLFGSNRKTAWEMGFNHPDPVPGEITTHSDLARFIEDRLDLLGRNALQGAVLVFFTLLAFLNWRAAFWVMTGLVTALCGTLVMMTLTGITLNLLSMFGLIIVIGMLVDDAIVVTENIQSRYDRGETALQAAIRGTEQVAWPIVGIVTTTIVAFVPLVFVRGRIGDLLASLPIVVACALTVSLMETVLILPSHIGHSLVKRDKARPGRWANLMRRLEQRRDRIIHERILPAYERLLRVLLEYRYITTAVTIAVLIVSLGMVAGGRLEYVFLDESDAETIVVDVRMPIGTSLAETDRVMRQLEAAAAAQPEVLTISTNVGQSASVESGQIDTNATHVGQMFVELVPVELRDRESSLVIAAMREHHGIIDGPELLRYSEISGGPAGADITIQVMGEDMSEMERVVAAIKYALRQREGVYDIADDNYSSQRELQIRLHPHAAALGFNNDNVARQVRGALFGIDAHVFSANREDIDVRVRLDERSRRTLSTIENLWIISPTGQRVPLGEVADLIDGTGHATIRRIDRERAITVTADVAPHLSPETIMEDLQPELAKLAADNPAITIDFGGRQRDMSKAFASLPLGAGVALLLVYVILAWLFSSYVQPLIVMLAIPFGIIGVIWGHLFFGYRATFLSTIGLIALCGIVVNNSLILVQFFNEARTYGISVREALLQAGRQRFRPILMTSITTFLGLTPLMLEQSFQAKFLIPMAISIGFGLVSSTVLVLTMLPCFMMILDDIRRALYYLWHGLPCPEPAQPPPAAPAMMEAE